MADPHTAAGAGRFEVRATASDHFAWVRTRLALEPTITAWLRTAVALIGFGFAIVLIGVGLFAFFAVLLRLA